MSQDQLPAQPAFLSRLRHRMPWILGAILIVCGISGTAYAFWQSSDSSNFAAASADSLAQGSTPTATTTNATTVGVSWSASTTTGGRAVTGYTVARYNAPTTGTKTPATSACAGTVTSTSCTELNVPGGTWYYTVTPTLFLWTGGESPRSTGVSTDGTPPTVIVASISPVPNVNGYNKTSPVTVNLSATDTGGSGVASVTYWVDAGTHSTVNATTAVVSVTGDGTHTVSYFATDNAGNASTTQTQTVKIDTAAPVAPTVGVPSFVNSANVSNVPVSGTAEANATVNLTVTDVGAAHTVTQTATASGTGVWSTSSLNLSTLSQGTISYSATATDAAGNTGPAATATDTKDTTAPVAPSVGVPSFVNSANVSNVPVSGTAETNATVNLTVTDVGAAHTVTQAATASGTGVWSTSSLNLSTLSQGTISYSATATDAAGNTGPAATATDTKDTAAETATITAPAYLNSATTLTSVAISGTSDSNAAVLVSAHDSAGTPHTATASTTAGAGGTWNTTINLTGFIDGTVTYTFTETDAAGNQGTASTTSTKDTAAPAGLIITCIAGNTGNPVTLTCTGNAGNASGDAFSIAVVITKTGQSTITTSGTRAAATWTTGSSLTIAKNITGWTGTATQTDAAGNSSTAVTTFNS